MGGSGSKIDDQHNIMFLGEDGAGKTSLITVLIDKKADISKIQKTEGFQDGRHEYKNFMIQDTQGGDFLKNVNEALYKNNQCFIYVVNSELEAEQLVTELTSFQEKLTTHEDLKGKAFAICFNKSDKKKQHDFKKIIAESNLVMECKKSDPDQTLQCDLKVFVTSAKDPSSLNSLMQWLSTVLKAK